MGFWADFFGQPSYVPPQVQEEVPESVKMPEIEISVKDRKVKYDGITVAKVNSGNFESMCRLLKASELLRTKLVKFLKLPNDYAAYPLQDLLDRAAKFKEKGIWDVAFDKLVKKLVALERQSFLLEVGDMSKDKLDVYIQKSDARFLEILAAWKAYMVVLIKCKKKRNKGEALKSAEANRVMKLMEQF